MMVERSTSHRSAASPMVVSWRTSCSQISYFCSGVKNRLARRPRRSVPRLKSDMIRRSLLGQEPKRMLSDHKPDPYRKLRRKPGLRRKRIDLQRGTVTVAEQLMEVNGVFSVGPP